MKRLASHRLLASLPTVILLVLLPSWELAALGFRTIAGSQPLKVACRPRARPLAANADTRAG